MCVCVCVGWGASGGDTRWSKLPSEWPIKNAKAFEHEKTVVEEGNKDNV